MKSCLYRTFGAEAAVRSVFLDYCLAFRRTRVRQSDGVTNVTSRSLVSSREPLCTRSCALITTMSATGNAEQEGRAAVRVPRVCEQPVSTWMSSDALSCRLCAIASLREPVPLSQQSRASRAVSRAKLELLLSRQCPGVQRSLSPVVLLTRVAAQGNQLRFRRRP